MKPTIPYPPALATTLLAALLLLPGCGTLGEPAAVSVLDPGMRIAAQARQLLGTPYRYGGNGPRGFDCSGLVQYTHRLAGISVPRTTRGQLAAARAVSRSQLRVGDLIFFRLSGRRKVSHVGIYVGQRRMIHAPSSGKRVAYASIDQDYWRQHIIKVGRLY